MATNNQYASSFTSDSSVVNTFVTNFLPINEIMYFSQFYNLTEEELKDMMLGQVYTDGFIQALATFVLNRTSWGSGSSEEEKWSNFKASFPVEMQPAVQVMIDKEIVYTGPPTTFAAFAARTTDVTAQNILDLNTDPSDFWTPYAKYLKDKANLLLDDWIPFENSITDVSDIEYKSTLAYFNNKVEGEAGFSDLKSFLGTSLTDYILPNIKTYKLDWAKFLGDAIKVYSRNVFEGDHSPEEQEELFYNYFRPELRKGIRQLIAEFKDSGFITDFEDLKDRGGVLGFAGANVNMYGPGSYHVIDLYTNSTYWWTTEFSTQGIRLGEVIRFDYDGTIISYTINNLDMATILQDIVDLMNAAGGAWANITAVVQNPSGTIRVTHSIMNTPITIFSASNIASEVFQIFLDNTNHPIYSGLAELFYNDATAVNTDVSEVRLFKGRLVKTNEHSISEPLAGYNVKITDIDSFGSPVLGTVVSDSQGNFSITYSVQNKYIESKSLRIEVLDDNDDVLQIYPVGKETNLFTDALNGNFEGGTAPDYDEWNLTLGTDIEIADGETLGEEILLNGSFDSPDGWYSDDTQTTPSSAIMGGHTVGGYQSWTAGILEVGKKYRVGFDLEVPGSGTAYFYSDSTPTEITHIDHSGAPKRFYFDFVATTDRMGVTGPYGTFIDNMSIKELIPTAHEGDFSPKFYYNDDSTFASDIIFSGDTSIPILADTDYEISAYVYFTSPIVNEDAVSQAGMFLRPLVSYTIYTVADAQITNGVKEIRRKEGVITSVKDRPVGQWHKIKTIFNSGANTSMQVALALDGTIASLSDYVTENPGFSFSIDQVQVKKALQEYSDLSVPKPTGLQQAVEIMVEGLEATALEVAVAQEAGASDPHIVNITPINPEVGDVFVAILDGKYPVSYKATVDTVANVTAGLTAAIVAETASVSITQNQAPTTSLPQITYITPQNVLVGAKYQLKKTMKNLFIDGSKGTFETTSDTGGNPPSDWGLTKETAVINSYRVGSAYRGTYALSIEWSGDLAAGTHVLLSTNTAINVKQNTKYKISAYVKESGSAPAFNNAEFYFIPKGYARNQVVEVLPFKALGSGDTSVYRKIQTVFTTGSLSEIQFNFSVELKNPIVGAGGYWYIDEVCFEEVPDKATVIEYTATGGTVGSVVTGLTNALKVAGSTLAVQVIQKGDLANKHTIRVTPSNPVIGAINALEINGLETISYTWNGVGPSNITQNLKNAIDAKTSGEWTNVTVVDSGTYIDIIAKTASVRFSIKQIGGEWSDVNIVDETTHVKITGRDNDMPFTIEQVSSGWKTVTPSDEDFYVQVTGNEDDEPFIITTKVIKAPSANSTKPPVKILQGVLTVAGITLPPIINTVLAAKEVYTLEDIVALGGLKNNLDGELKIETTQVAASSDPQIVRITPRSINKGDVYILKINDYDTITYVSTEGTLTEVIAGLTAAINDATGDWTNVTATDEGEYIEVTYNTDNIIFTITQLKAADSPEIKKLESLASLYTVAKDLQLSDEKLFELLETLIKEGYTDALAIGQVSQNEFVNIVNKIIGDFNAARVYELAAVRKNITKELAAQFLAQNASYSNITKAAIPSGEKLEAAIGEQCYCDDCEAAVSPLAYLTDLINYVSKYLYYRQNITGSLPNGRGTFNTFVDLPFSLEKLSDTFYQNFVELPASCDDIKNTVCQPRIAIEVLRKYLATNIPTDSQKEQLASSTRAFVFKAYKFLLESIGTSYSEIRIVRREEDKIKLAEKLGFNYETNKDFLAKLFIEPKVVEMDTWAKFNSVMPGFIQALLIKMQADFTADTFTFEEFVLAETSEVKTQLLLLSTGTNGFYEILADILLEEARYVNNEVNIINIPLALKEEQKWSKWLFNLSSKFSPEFREAFEVINMYRLRNTGSFDTMEELITLSKTQLASLLTGAEFTTTLDFWTPFAAALKDKFEDFYLSEKDLEELFGLTDTRKDVFSDGAKFNDEANILQRWNIRGIKWKQNTDENGYIYLEMDEVDGVIRLFNNSERNDPTDLVAVATLDAATNKFIIAEYEDSGLSGELIISELDADSEIYISAIPLYLSWQLQAMREGWKLSDEITLTPVIDPDLIGPSDIKYPFGINTVTPATPIDLWQQRKTDLEAKYTEIKNAREDAVDPVYTLHGTSGSGSGQLNDPAGVAIDADGNLYIADKANDRIQKMTPNGTISTFVSGLTDPKAVLVTSSNRLIVLDGNVVKDYSIPGASAGWSFGSTGTALGQFTNSSDVALNKKGELYVTDNKVTGTSTGRIQRFTLPYNLTQYAISGELTILTTTESDSGVKQVTQVTPLKVRVGDTFKLTLQTVGTVEYTATAPTPANVIAGLIRAIELAGTWTAVTFLDKGDYIEFTATTANTPFALAFDNKITITSANQMAADRSGNIFITDKINSRVLKLDGEGNVVKVIGNSHRFTDQLITMYRLDDGTGTTTRDSSGATVVHNGTLIGAPAWTSLGKSGGALLFDGTNDALTIAAHNDLDSSNFSNRSIELWFNVTNKDLDQFQVLYKQGDHQKGLNIYIHRGRLYAGLYNGATSCFIYGQIPAGLWHHALLVFEANPADDMNTLRLYLDGVLIDSNNEHSLIPQSTSPDGINIGALANTKIKFHDGTTVSSNTSGHYFAGTLDTIRIWNRSIDTEEVDKLYTRLEDTDGTLFIPGKITVDTQGNVYVADKGTGRVTKFDADGTFVTKFGGYGDGNLLFKNISGLEIDAAGNIYVLDKENNTLQKVNQQGALVYKVGQEGDGEVEFDSPSDLTLDSGGFIYIADTANNRIQILEPQAGHYIDEWTTYTTGSLTAPIALRADSEDNIIVQAETNKIIRIPKDNSATALVLAGGSSPWAFATADSMALGVDGYIYLSLAGTTIRRFRFPEENTSVLLQKGISIPEPDFDTLWGIDTDPDDNLIVADVNHHRILKLTPEGYYVFSIGKEGETSGTGEGEFNKPYGIATDESGNIYVTDHDNNRVEKFNNKGEFMIQWINTFFTSNLDAPVAIFIDKNRKGYIANSNDDNIVVWDTLHGIGSLIKDEDLMDTSVAALLALSAKEKEGTNITEDLAALNIDLRSYRQLLKLIEFAESEPELLEEHLEDIYNIFLQVYKTGLYADWKKEEGDLGIILSQDFFTLRSKEEERAIELKEWRATKRSRKDWVEKLESRIDIEDTLWQAHKDMIKEAEDELYIELRDALIMATKFTGTTLLEKASDGSDKLIIDLKNNCCQRTTRISQAFETLQGAMWSLRTGLLQDTYPDWFINNTKFDEEWKWMGSYATWRAAQFVFMYPENILLPSYINKKSRPFNELLNTLRNTALLTPSAAYEYTKDYIDAVSDLNSISLSGTIQVTTRVSNNDAYYNTVAVDKDLVYLIGYSKTGSYYWAIIEPSTGKYFRDWELMEGFEEEDVYSYVGMTVYRNFDGKRRIYLFLQKSDKTLVHTCYDLDKREWNKTITDIDISSDRFENSSVQGKFVLNHKIDETEKIHLIFSATRKSDSTKHIFVTRLNDEVSKREDDWDHNGDHKDDAPLYNIDRRIFHFDTSVGAPYVYSAAGSGVPQPSTALTAGGLTTTTYTSGKIDTTVSGYGQSIKISVPVVFANPVTTATKMDTTVLNNVLEPIVGVIRLHHNTYGKIYYVFANKSSAPATVSTYYKLITETGVVLQDWYMLTYDCLAYVNGYFDQGKLFLIYQIKSRNASEGDRIIVCSPTITSYRIYLNTANGVFRTIQINPNLKEIPYYNPLNKDRRQLTEDNKKYFLKNQSLDESIGFYVKEYQYLVPMYIAYLLNKRGYYKEALDWYRLVYDYSAKEKGDRRIYYGLKVEDPKEQIVDDFNSVRIATPYTVLTTLTPGVSNPDPNRVNQSALCTEVAAPYFYSRINYPLPANHTIDFLNPNFSMSILDKRYGQNGPTKVIISALTAGMPYVNPTICATYSAITTGNLWEKLNFQTDYIIADFNPSDIKQLQISFQLVNNMYATGTNQVYYLADFVKGRQSFEKSSSWLTNPIDPHSIAATRDDSYTRYTIMAIAQCMMDYADSEYTQDTAESVPRARLLYEEALDLLNDEGLRSPYDDAVLDIEELALEVEAKIETEPEWLPVWATIKQDIMHVRTQTDLNKLLQDIRFIKAAIDTTVEEKLALIRTEVNVLLDNPTFFNKVHDYLSGETATGSDVYMAINASSELRNYIDTQASLISQQYLDKVKEITNVDASVLLSDTIYEDGTVMAQLRGTTDAVSSGILSPAQITGSLNDIDESYLNTFETDDPKLFLMKDLKRSLADLIDYKIEYKPSTNFSFCIPSNPIVNILRLKAELNLFKIRNCRNIAGVVREIDPFAAPTDAVSGIPSIGSGGNIQLPGTAVLRPTIYRYPVLIERAKQLVQLAQQVEASMLATLEKLDAERYNMLKAKQDLALSKAGIKLQNLRVKESQDSIKLAELQRDRAQLQYDGLQEMIDAGLNEYEQKVIEAYNAIEILANIMATLNAASTSIGGGLSVAGAGVGASMAAPLATALGILAGVQAGIQSGINDATRRAQVNSIYASFERQKQDWEFQKDLAGQDIKIGDQQVKIANDQLAVVGQERQIAELQADHAQATIDFLNNKFTNAELYDWMSGILEGVYSFFLQQATAIAKLAQAQLAFERQEVPSDFIKNDYWSAPADNLLQSGSGDDKSTDRKGLTGSTRLLQDIFQLDQFAFNTDKRKLELTKTISLASMFPAEFQRFKETGELVFETRMEVFDRDFPGHYLRLIRRVSTSVIALVPPSEGIKATLSNLGVTYAVTGGILFQKVPVVRSPESIALTGTMGATGMFEMNPLNTNDKLFPFENTGVEGRWAFSMPKASNFFDYSTIADILFTIEYTALHDDFYSMQVIEELDIDIDAERPFSFKNQFADQWYDLCNPELTDTPMKVKFTVTKQDFPTNIREMRMKNLLMYFVKSDDMDPLDVSDEENIERINELPVNMLRFTPKGSKTTYSATGVATARNGILSTKKVPITTTWGPFISNGLGVEGTWELEFKEEHKGLFKNKKISDILFVISYEGEAPEWPK